MPNKKKRAFSKENSVKFLLMQGNKNAVNADGDTLENVLVPISKNYKPGTSLLMSKLAELVNESNPPGGSPKTPDLENIMGQFEDASNSEDESFETEKKDLDNLHLKRQLKNTDLEEAIVEEDFEEDDASSNFSDNDSNFSDASEEDDFSHKPDRPENLKILDQQMKKKIKEYEDDQLGALDDEEICGFLTGDSKRLNNYLDPSLDEEETVEYDKCDDESIKEKILMLCEEETTEKFVEIVTEKPIEFDCESIISTYSNKYNHPALIKEVGKVRKITVSNNPLKNQLTKSKLKQLDFTSESEEESDDDKVSIVTTLSMRPKDETPEQRRERKNLFKELKRESRKLKKENKLAFKHEKKLQTAQTLNSQSNQGIRLH